jgi:23S rRNA (adenine2503-C2)-methyltransferase
MPINNKYPLEDLLQACRDYPVNSQQRRITIEYVMLAEVNDSDDDARQLAKILNGIPCKVNLIPFNAWPGSDYTCSSGNRMHKFAKILTDSGLDAPIRKPRGRDILAACGQLKSASKRLTPAVKGGREESAGVS